MRLVVLAGAAAALVACSSDPERPHVQKSLSLPEEQGTLSSNSTRHEPAPPPTVRELVDGGTHWRIDSAHGPIHVFLPKRYDASRAETIVYVHGYYVHVDDAWQSYKLDSQFAASAIDAMFIACEAPAWPDEPVSWDDFGALLAEVERATGQASPKRRVVAVGHSAAYRTLLGWLDEPSIDTIVLVDAAYGEIDQYKNWVNASQQHRLIDVGDDTRAWTDQLHAELPETVVIDGFPSVEQGIPETAAKARILYIKSNLGHFPLVTNGVALPMILRTLRAKRLVREPLAEILERP